MKYLFLKIIQKFNLKKIVPVSQFRFWLFIVVILKLTFTQCILF